MSLKVAVALVDLGVMVYAPTQKVVRQWLDPKKKVQVPVMPSIVLVNLQGIDTGIVFQVSGVVRYLFEQGKRVKVRDKDIVAMQLHLEGKAIVAQTGLRLGGNIQAPKLDEKATVVALQGKKCLARLERLSTVVSFQLQ